METLQFIEQVLTIKGVQDFGSSLNPREGVISHRLIGPNGRVVIVDCSEEDISEETMKGHLAELGLIQHIPVFCPILSSPKPNPAQLN